MDSSQNQPLPPGVGTWSQAPPNHPPQFNSDPQSYHSPFDTRHDTASGNNSDSAAGIESAVQEAVLHAQDVETQQVIQNQRYANTTSEPTAYGEDLLSNRRDPNALKEHLLKMTADHRAEMANKRGKPVHPNNGNVEIGNGYGVPGGGAYYAANLPSTQMNKPRDESDKAKCANDLPDFLKQRLRARGILKDETTNKNSMNTQNVDSQEIQNKSGQELPPGWTTRSSRELPNKLSRSTNSRSKAKKMARTRLTARKSTRPPRHGIAPSHAPVDPWDEEEEEEIFQQPGDDSDEDAVAVEQETTSPPAPSPAPAPAPTPTPAPAPTPVPTPVPVVDLTDEEPEADAEPETWTKWVKKDYGQGVQMADILRWTCHCLGYSMRPLYKCSRFTHPRYPTFWEVKVVLREEHEGGWEVKAIHHDVTIRRTMESGIAEAARRALEVVSHNERPRLERTYHRFLPYRASGEARTFIATNDGVDLATDYLRKYTSAALTALNEANNHIQELQQEVQELRWERDANMAAATGAPPPQEFAVHPASSPSPKRPRYDSPGAAAEDL